MRAYVIRRILIVIPTVCVVSMIVFFLVRLIPGDIIDRMMAVILSEQGGFGATLDRAMIEHELGLDAPLLVQYGRWVGVVPQVNGNFSGIFQGDFGISWMKRAPVFELVANAWPVTFQLGLMGLIISQLIALPIGIYSALRQDTWGDYIARSFAILCISVPGFWLATMVLVFPSIWWGYMPPIMLIPFIEDPIGNLQMFIVPAIVLGMAMAGITMRMTRTMMLEVLRQDYIRTAWAKGLRERVVVLRHALKNALIPVVTLIGLQVPVLIGGTVIIEQIFVLPGMGRLILAAILDRDHPLTSGVMLLFAIAIMLTNLMVDLTYGYLDPRVHYK
ncbi:Glutathione transport system permease protein GsiC [subsurface metagenome]